MRIRTVIIVAALGVGAWLYVGVSSVVVHYRSTILVREGR